MQQLTDKKKLDTEVIDLYNNGMSIKDISNIYKHSNTSIQTFLKNNNVKLRRSRVGSSYKNQIINLYNKNYSIAEISRELPNCSYGIIQYTLTRLNLKVKSGSERTKTLNMKSSKFWKGFGEISGSRWCIIKYGAKQRNIGFFITIEDGWNQYLKQGGLSIYTGEKLIHQKNNKDTNYTASLDRINSKLPYTVNNIQWVEKQINRMQWGVPDELFLNLCEHVAYPQFQDKCDIDFNLIKIPHRFIKNNLTENELLNLFIKQNGRCAISNLEISFNGRYKNETAASLDRIDSNFGYTMNNIQWVNKNINKMKLNTNQKDFIFLCKKITDYQRSIYAID